MKPLGGVLVGLALGAVAMLFARNQDFGRLARELEVAEDSIAALTPVVAHLTARTDSLRTLALTRDTVLVTVTEDATAEIDRLWDVARASADSLRVTLDSVEAAHLTTLENAHADEVAAVWRVADERLAWGEDWRTFALTSDSLVKVQAATLAQWAIRDAIMRGEVRKARTGVYAGARASRDPAVGAWWEGGSWDVGVYRTVERWDFEVKQGVRLF